MLTIRFRFHFALIVMSALLLCAGCGETKLDTSNDQAFSESLEKMYNSVPEAEREDFLRHVRMVLEGRAFQSAPDYEDITQTYSLVKGFGKEKDIAQLNKLNGLTRADVIAQGTAIMKKDIEERLTQVNTKIEAASKEAESAKAFDEELKKVTVEFGRVKAAESQNIYNKGMMGTLTVELTITNGSSRKLNGFRDDRIVFTDASGKKASGMTIATLGAIIAEDGSKPFKNGFSEKGGLAVGQSIKGKALHEFSSMTKDYPYPPESEYTPSLEDGELKPILEGEQEINTWSARQSIEILERLTEEKAKLEAELAKIK